MSELASFFVRIRPDTRFFKQEAEAGIRAGKPDDVAVGVSADTTSADDKLRTFSGRLDALRLKTATVGIDLNDRGAVGKLAALDAAIDRLDRLRANPKVDVDGIARAEAEVESLNLQLDRLDGRRVTAGSGGRGGLFNRLAGYGSSGGFFSPGGFAGLALGLAPAAVPAGVGALGLGASFLTPGVAGTAGLGLFGAATAGAYKRVSKVEDQLDTLNKRIAVTPQTTSTTTGAASASQIKAATLRLDAARQRLAVAEANPASSIASLTSARAGVLSAQSSLASLQARGGTTTKPNAEYDKLVKQRKQLLDSLSPAERKAAEETDKLEKVWTHFQQALEPESFKLLATGLDIVTKALHDAEPMTKAVGDDIDSLAKRADDALSQPFWKNFFGDFLTVEAPRAVDALGTTVGNVVTGIAHLSEVWAPLGHSLETEMVSISSNFERWTEGQGPGAFMALVQRDGPIVANALVGIAHGIHGIAVGIEPIGRIELQALTPVLNFIGDVGEQDPAVITAIGVAYLGVAAGLKAIAAVKGISGAAAAIRGLGRGGKPGTGAGSVLGDLTQRGSSPAEPLYVIVVNEGVTGVPRGTEPVPTGSPSEGGGIFTKLFGVFDRFPKTSAAAGALAIGAEAGQGAYHAVKSMAQGATGVAGSALSSLGQTAHDFGQGSAFGDFGDFLKNAGSIVTTIAGLKHHTDDLTTAQKNAAAAAKQDADQLSALDQLLVVNPGLMEAASHGNQKLAASMQVVIGQARVEAAVLGHDLGQGLIQGLEDEIPHATVAGKLLVQSTAKAMRLAADANSPSRVTQQLGVDMSTGLAVGIDQGAYVAEAAVQRLVDKLAGRLKVLQSQSKATAQGVTSALLGGVGIGALGSTADSLGGVGGVPTSPAGIIAGLTGQRNALRLLRHQLHIERRHGLSPQDARDIAELGLQQSGAVAQSLIHATPKQLHEISHLDAVLRRTARGTGQDIAGDIYGARIAEQTRVLKEIHQEIAGGSGHRVLTESDYHRLKQILDDALHGNPVSLDTGKTGRHSARKVDVS